MMISVVVPIYNVERYIEGCICSLLCQSYVDYELILVNDGCTDGTMACVTPLVDGKDNIRIFHRENGGVSSARNFGMEQASGDWITFVDSDDTVLPDYLERLAASVHDCDLVLSGDMYMHKGVLARKDVFSEKYWRKEDGWDEDSSAYLGNMTSLHGKLFRRNVITSNGLRFNPNLSLGEDRDFCISYIAHIDAFRYIRYAGYCYNTDIEGSLSKQRVLNLLKTDLSYWNKLHSILGDACPKYQMNRVFNFFFDDMVAEARYCGWMVAAATTVQLRAIADVHYLYLHRKEIHAPFWQKSIFLILLFVFCGRR